MRPMRADFALPRAVSAWWWSAIGAAVSLAVALAWDRVSTIRSITGLRAEQVAHDESIEAMRDVSAVVPPTAPKAYDFSAREMLHQHETPWPRLLDAMEAVGLQDVRVVNLDYAAAEGQARVEIAVAQQALALDYVAALNWGLPDSDAAWRWSVLRIEQGRIDGAARAVLVSRWATR
jgi:hypothetical protein